MTDHGAVSRDDSPPPRLNLFALPGLTTLLFALIAGVILVAIGAGLRQNISALGVMIAAGMVVLPLRDFLRQVEKDLRSLGLSPLPATPPPPSLVQEVAVAAHDLRLSHPPRLVAADRPIGPVTIGSWRRRYLALGRPQADRLDKLPSITRRTLWLHEVAHFANGDHWKVGLARSLLRSSIVFMAWSALFLLGIVIMAYVYGLELFEPGYLDTLSLDPALRDLLASFWPDPALTAPLLEKARATHLGLAALYVLNAHLPFIVSGIVLLIFVWRRLVQVRELYADARVAAQVGDAEEARRALVRVSTTTVQWAAGAPERLQDRLAGLRQWFDRALPFHPSWQVRFACLKDPLQVFGSWRWAGFTAGLTVLLLDLILVGPFTLSYVSSGPAHFATLTGFVILALWLAPGICQGFPSTSQMVGQAVKATLLFVGLRAGWLLLNSVLVLALLILAPAQARDLLLLPVFLANKVLTPVPVPSLPQDPVTLAIWVIGGGWGFMGLTLLCLLAGFLLTAFLFRRLLTWYAFPTADRRLLRVGWSAILLVALVLGFIVLPLPTALILGDLTSLLHPLSLIVAGVTLLLTIGGGLWFFYTDRRYGGRCLACDSQIAGWFELGKKCPTCGETLHPWLLADY